MAANRLNGGKYKNDHFVLRSFYKDQTLTFFVTYCIYIHVNEHVKMFILFFNACTVHVHVHVHTLHVHVHACSCMFNLAAF